MSIPNADSGQCANCNSTHLTLAKDATTYSPCEMVQGKWYTTYRDVQPSQEDDGTRFFCADCGTQHSLPGELL